MKQEFENNKELLECINKWFEEKNIKFKFIKETDDLFPTFIIEREKVTWNIIIFTDDNIIKFEVYNNDDVNMFYIHNSNVDYNSVIYGLNVALNVFTSMLTYNTCMEFEEYISAIN